MNQAMRLPLRGLLVRAEGKHFSGGADVATFSGRTVDEARQRFTATSERSVTSKNCRFPRSRGPGGMHGSGSRTRTGMRPHLGGVSARFGQVEASIGTTTLLGGVQRSADAPAQSRP